MAVSCCIASKTKNCWCYEYGSKARYLFAAIGLSLFGHKKHRQERGRKIWKASHVIHHRRELGSIGSYKTRWNPTAVGNDHLRRSTTTTDTDTADTVGSSSSIAAFISNQLQPTITFWRECHKYQSESMVCLVVPSTKTRILTTFGIDLWTQLDPQVAFSGRWGARRPIVESLF